MSRAVRRGFYGTLVVVAAALLLAPAALAGRQVVRLVLDSPVLEAPREEMDLALLFGQGKPRTLRHWVETIRKAARDGQVAGLALILAQPELNLAQVEELTRALAAFRQSGKKVYCYMDAADNASYALAAAADHVTLAENGLLATAGLHAEMIFFKGLLDKLGIEADMMHCGAYKSALEPFTRTEPSPEATEQVNWLLDGIFARYVRLIAEGRGLSEQEVRAAIDAAPLEAAQARQRRLVDEVSSFPAFKQMIRKQFGPEVEIVKRYGKKQRRLDLGDVNNPFEFLPKLFKLLSGAMPEVGAPPKPALGLIYIDGGIMLGKNQPDPFFGGSTAGSTTIRAAFEQARRDESIKAVVARVDSPGGSALASDIIWKAARRCGQDKPLIVSMGRVAGSGGYYVSIPADTIFAEETTLTGSIGVVGGKLVWNGLLAGKLGITTSEFDRGRHAGLMSMNRRWNDAERAWMTAYMNSVYEQFKSRVKASRGQRLKGELEELAGGRVYTGKQALERGLIDRIGGLSDALEFAAKKAGLADYQVRVLPEKKDVLERILELVLDRETEDEWEISAPPPVLRDPLAGAALPLLRGIAPGKLRQIGQGLRNALILQREHVGCFMPFALRIR